MKQWDALKVFENLFLTLINENEKEEILVKILRLNLSWIVQTWMALFFFLPPEIFEYQYYYQYHY